MGQAKLHASSPRMSAASRLWQKLVEAPARLPLSQRRTVQLLSTFLVAMIALSVAYELLYIALSQPDSTFTIETVVAVGTIGLLIAAYALCRTGRITLSAAITVAVMSVGIFAIVVTASSTPNVVNMLVFLAIPFLIGNIFFTSRQVLLLIVLYSLGMFMLPVLVPGIPLDILLAGPIPFLWITASIVVISNRHRDRLERDRQSELAANERRFRALIDHIDDGIELVDAEGYVRYASPSVERILGNPPDEYVGRNGLDFIHPDDLADAAAKLAQVGQGMGQLVSAAYRMRHKDGTWRWIEGTAANFIDDPAVGNIVITFRDITERKQRERELETIAVVGSALRTVMSRVEVLPIVLDQAMALLNARGAALVLRDPARDEMAVELGQGVWANNTGQRVPPGESITSQVIAAGQPYLKDDAASDPVFGSALTLSNLHGAVVPLVAQGKVIGALWIGIVNTAGESDIRLITAVADIAAGAINRVTLLEQTEQRLQRLTALRAIGTAITASLDLNIAFDVLLQQLTTQLGIDAADVLLLNPHTNVLEFAAGRGFRRRAIERSRVRLGEGLAGSAALERQLVDVPDLRLATNMTRASLLEGEGFAAYFGAPLVVKGYVKGVLEVFHRGPFTPDADWRDFLFLLAEQAAIAIDNAKLFEGLQRSNIDLTLAYDATIEGWSRALDLRDKETEGHTQRVAQMTERLAQVMGIGAADLVHIHRGAMLHDIGKMGVPDNILLKPGKLTDEEWVIMRKHPQYAYEMLSPITFLRPALDIPYCHHEKWDGTGYPRGLKGEQIPLAARIFAVVDVWDALTSDRPYRAAWSRERTREHICAGAGTHFDPHIVDVFLNMLDEG